MFYFRNDHFLPEKLEMHVFHKNLQDFFRLFMNTTFENTLLVDAMLHKSMFDLPFSAIFFETFYGSHNNGNYLLETVLPWNPCIHPKCKFINL
jgi:hypothetical protein